MSHLDNVGLKDVNVVLHSVFSVKYNHYFGIRLLTFILVR